jgi:D-cysteine desulfhydrase
LDALEREGGDGELWLKDDGQFGEEWGGNKPRKLEWVLPDVRRRARRTIVTVGATGTNHGLATALNARAIGIETVLVLVDQPWDEHVSRQLERIEASGARVYRTRSVARTVALLPLILARHADWRRLRAPYFLTVGGSSPLGAVAYVDAALELADQVSAGELPAPDQVVVPLGSGGTAAGLVLGLAVAGLDTRVVAVQVNHRAALDANRIRRLAQRTRRLLERRGVQLPRRLAEVRVEERWLGGGYGHPTEEAQHAIELAREREGLRLDPVYTGKAMAALLELRAQRELPGTTLYWHTANAKPDGLLAGRPPISS